MGVPFHVHQRYTLVRPLGVGSYGCVALAHDSVLDVTVAYVCFSLALTAASDILPPSIKKMSRVFNNRGIARHALREVAILRHLSFCDNSVVLLDFDASFAEWDEIYLIMAPSEANLAQIIRSRQALSNAHVQYFAVQLLRGVRYMHTAHIVHRDLKPSNLLVNADCALRICDYGLARAWSDAPRTTRKESDTAPSSRLLERCNNSDEEISFRPKLYPNLPGSAQLPQQPARTPICSISRVSTQEQNTRYSYPGEPLSGHVATRWYRAPEVLLQFREGYGPEMDMWSVGCILAELLLGRPLFPGKDSMDQLRYITQQLGNPSEATLVKSMSASARTKVASWSTRAAADLGDLFPEECDPLAIDLIRQLLKWEPEERFTAAQSLEHPWLTAYAQSSATWSPPSPFTAFDSVELTTRRDDMVNAFQMEQGAMHAEWCALVSETKGRSMPRNNLVQKQTPGSTPTPTPALTPSASLVVSPASTECTTSVATPSDDSRSHALSNHLPQTRQIDPSGDQAPGTRQDKLVRHTDSQAYHGLEVLSSSESEAWGP